MITPPKAKSRQKWKNKYKNSISKRVSNLIRVTSQKRKIGRSERKIQSSRGSATSPGEPPKSKKSVEVRKKNWKCNPFHNCQVPTPISQKLEFEQQIRFWNRLTHEFLGRLKFTIPNMQIYLPKMANSEKLGMGLDNPCRAIFLSLGMNKCLERVHNSRVYFSFSYL